MKIIGLTGASGSGKTSVGAILAARGGYIIDADKVARDVMKPGEPALDEIVRRFGSAALKDGELDRRALGELVFFDADSLRDLNDITHKYILSEIYNELERVKNEGEYEFIAIDAPLLVETGLHKAVDEIWLIRAARETSIKRVTERDDITDELAGARLDARSRLDEIERMASKIIDNSGDLERLEKLVDECLG
ncbi:MAG: dephospho-CoA kinase [Clostridiales bacterium]|jgi:dephospho-CoA kinase|nr:dephospho-CoA kinase [Clostridiales bacterium]